MLRALVLEDGRSALLSMRMGGPWTKPSWHTLRLDFEGGIYVDLAPTSQFALCWSELPSEPFARPDRAWITGRETAILLDTDHGNVAEPCPLLQCCEPAGQGWIAWDRASHSERIIDPYHGRFSRESFAVEPWARFLIGPESWWICDWYEWFQYFPETGELRPAPIMNSVQRAGPMLPDGRVLVTLSDRTYALLDSRGGFTTLAAPSFSGQLLPTPEAFRPGEPLLVETALQRYLLDVDCLELRPVDASYRGELLRWTPDGALFFQTARGIERRDPVSGARTLVFSFADAREEVGS